MTRDDDYGRWVDLKFQEMADRKASAQEQELLKSLRDQSASDEKIHETRQGLRKFAILAGKTEAEAYIWADEILREGRKLLNADPESK